jgi:hypothetical protein
MKLHRVAPGEATDALAGMVLCQDVEGDGARLRKGRVLRAADLPALRSSPNELHLVELEPGDVHEDEAGRVEVRDQATGQWPLVATRRGVLRVAVDALRGANSVDGVLVYTLLDGQVVDASEEVARARIAPFVLEGRRVEEAERAARSTPDGGLVRVRPFIPRRVGAVVQETLGQAGAARFRAALGEKLAWFGSTLLEPAFVSPDGDALAAAMERQVADGAEVLVVAGTKALDPLDASWGALDRLGVSLERVGAPAHPGSFFWIAWRGALPILGMPTCGVLAHATVFDLVLPRVLAGERVGRAELAELGHGGLLTQEMAFRFPPYRRGGERGVVSDESVG